MLEPNTSDDRPRPHVNGKHHSDLGLEFPEASVIPAETPEPPPSGAVLQPLPADEHERQWFLAALWSEFRLAGRMYFDPRYRISRTAQFATPAILILFVLNYLFFSAWLSIPVLSPILERLACIILAVFSYKVLTRELVRYRNVLDYLSKYAAR